MPRERARTRTRTRIRGRGRSDLDSHSHSYSGLGLGLSLGGSGVGFRWVRWVDGVHLYLLLIFYLGRGCGLLDGSETFSGCYGFACQEERGFVRCFGMMQIELGNTIVYTSSIDLRCGVGEWVG